MRRTIVLLATMALTVLVASGVALAVTKIGGPGPDTLRGTNGADNLLGNGGNDVLYALGGRDTLLGGEGKDWVMGGNQRHPKEARRPWWEVQETTGLLSVAALATAWAEPATIS
jgi:Ca2+-binding RTX toxin-like protein